MRLHRWNAIALAALGAIGCGTIVVNPGSGASSSTSGSESAATTGAGGAGGIAASSAISSSASSTGGGSSAGGGSAVSSSTSGSGGGGGMGLSPWVDHFGGLFGDYLTAITADGPGDVFFTGFFDDAIDFGGGPIVNPLNDPSPTSAGYITRLDPAGGHVWSLGLFPVSVPTGSVVPMSIALDPAGNVLVSGQMGPKITIAGSDFTVPTEKGNFIAKLSPSGALLWVDAFPTLASSSATPNGAYAVAADAQGNVVSLVGYYGSTDFGAGPVAGQPEGNLALVKLDPAGKLLWSKSFASSPNGLASIVHAGSVAVDPAGDVIIGGSFVGAGDFGGGSVSPAGSFVAKFSSSGDHLWSHGYGYGSVLSVAIDGTSPILAGSFTGDMVFGGTTLHAPADFDGFVARLDGAGNPVWIQGFSGPDFDFATSVAVDGAGNVALAGTVSGGATFGGMMIPGTSNGMVSFAARLGPGGIPIAIAPLGPGPQPPGMYTDVSAEGIAFDGAGGLIVGGQFFDSLALEGQIVTSSSYYDVFLARLGSGP
jgi:hypothetical protein